MSPVECPDCLETFKSSVYLDVHQKKVKYCSKYKNVLFTCKLCGFITAGIKNIDRHITKCQGGESSDPFAKYTERIQALESELKLLRIKTEKPKIDMNELTLERFKSSLFRHLIEKNTNIRIGDFLEEKTDGLHLYDNGQLSIFLHSRQEDIVPVKHHHNIAHVKKSPSPVLVEEESPQKGKKGKTFRSAKIYVDLIEESENQLAQQMSTQSHNERLALIPRYNTEQHESSFAEFIDSLKTNRVYTSTLKEITKLNSKMFGTVNITDYIRTINEQNTELTTIFEGKKYPPKKIAAIVRISQSAIDTRLLGIYDTSTYLEADDFNKLENALVLSTIHEERFTPFDISVFINQFYNYGSVLFTIPTLLKFYLNNPYGYHNVIYLDLPKSSDNDPFSFYTLNRTFRNKRYWTMDCRMEDLCDNIFEQLVPYLVATFRAIYKSVFGDNEYRDKYSDNCQFTECDCKQIVQNIIFITDRKNLRKAVLKIVKENCTYTPTENDRFNIFADDVIQRKQMIEKDDIDIVDIIKQLFNSITAEEAVDFLRK